MSAVLQDRGRELVVVERHRIGERWRSERWGLAAVPVSELVVAAARLCVQRRRPRRLRSLPRGRTRHRGLCGEHARARTRAHGGYRIAADDSGFDVSLTDSSLHARNVVIGTGPFQRTRIAALAADLASSVLQTDQTRYRNQDDLPGGSVLVVGSGASGCQIADELLAAGRRVYLSVSRHPRAPRRYRGRDVYWWLEKLGRFAQTIDTFPGRAWPPSPVVTGVDGGYDVNVRKMAAHGVSAIGRVVGADATVRAIDVTANNTLVEADAAYTAFLSAADQWADTDPEENLTPDEPAETPTVPHTITETTSLDLRHEGITSVIRATGYEYDYPWLFLPILDDRRRPVQQHGVTAVPGAYFLGLHWMHTIRSGLSPA